MKTEFGLIGILEYNFTVKRRNYSKAGLWAAAAPCYLWPHCNCWL